MILLAWRMCESARSLSLMVSLSELASVLIAMYCWNTTQPAGVRHTVS